ncbi:integumentary mucin A.1-like [Haliotis rufescens]|uniref:integumentary mucin A.1-like n=1 Tax=Haliotis rufescens TaxID=6454 RepID=UPI00201F6E7F|nr:integumentary mucin A.1-like [Haliotis rufescens]
MSKRLNAKTRSDMGGKRSRGDENVDMTAELWGEVYDMLCGKIKADDVYAKIRSKMRKLTEPKKVAPKKTIKKIQKKKPSKPAAAAASTTTTTAAVVTTAAATPTTTTTLTTAPVTTTTAATTAAATDTETTSFLKPATPATSAKRRSRKKLSLKISPQEQLTPDVSSAQSVLEQWWEQTPREPTYSPNAPVTMMTGDSDDHEALKLATLPSMESGHPPPA